MANLAVGQEEEVYLYTHAYTILTPYISPTEHDDINSAQNQSAWDHTEITVSLLFSLKTEHH